MAVSMQLDQAAKALSDVLLATQLPQGSLVAKAGPSSAKALAKEVAGAPLTPTSSSGSLPGSSGAQSPGALAALQDGEPGTLSPVLSEAVVIEGMLPSGMFEDEWEELVSHVASPTAAPGSVAPVAATEVAAALKKVEVVRLRGAQTNASLST